MFLHHRVRLSVATSERTAVVCQHRVLKPQNPFRPTSILVEDIVELAEMSPSVIFFWEKFLKLFIKTFLDVILGEFIPAAEAVSVVGTQEVFIDEFLGYTEHPFDIAVCTADADRYLVAVHTPSEEHRTVVVVQHVFACIKVLPFELIAEAVIAYAGYYVDTVFHLVRQTVANIKV